MAEDGGTGLIKTDAEVATGSRISNLGISDSGMIACPHADEVVTHPIRLIKNAGIQPQEE